MSFGFMYKTLLSKFGGNFTKFKRSLVHSKVTEIKIQQIKPSLQFTSTHEFTDYIQK